MKKKQALLRIESLIETDYKQIKEYNSVFFSSITQRRTKESIIALFTRYY